MKLVDDTDVDDTDYGFLADIWKLRDMSSEAGQWNTGEKMGWSYAQHHAAYYEIKGYEKYLKLISICDDYAMSEAMDSCRFSLISRFFNLPSTPPDNYNVFGIKIKDVEAVRKDINPEKHIFLSEDFDYGFLIGLLKYVMAKCDELPEKERLLKKRSEDYGPKTEKEIRAALRFIKCGKITLH